MIKENNMSKITPNDIEEAYRKLKSYFYYDNFSSVIRESIARFEASNDFENRLESLRKYLNLRNPQNSPFLSKYLEGINVLTIPKSYKQKNPENKDEFILTNKIASLPFSLDRLNYLIDAPIEIHIISVLWIIKEGFHLQECYDRHNYAYKIALEEGKNKVVPGLRLFEKYFEQYQDWRDKSIDTAKSLLENNQDATIIQMDIKEYFHNVSVDFDVIKRQIKERTLKQPTITNILEKIYLHYNEKLNEANPEYTKSKGLNALPIGLLSSGVIGNWFLHKFDNQIVSKLAPSFYGRYVDDITIVLSNTTLKRSKKIESPFKNFINEYFVKRGLLTEKEIDEETIYYLNLKSDDIVNHPLFIQKRKFSILEFSHKESHAALNNFIIKLKENSSIFWMLPEDEKDSVDFDKSANDLIYSDTVNKLRSLNEIVPSKFGASVFLAKRILSSLLSDENPDEQTDEQILSFFKGRYSLEFYQLWEKVCTYFVINNKAKNFWMFYKSCEESIDTISSDKNADNVIKVKSFLKKHLFTSIALATSLRPKFLFDINSNIHRKFVKHIGSGNLKEIGNLTIAYRKSNMLRHNYVPVPLLNYCNYTLQFNSPYLKSLLVDNEIGFLNSADLNDLQLNKKHLRFSPRYVKLFETNLHTFYKFIIGSTAECEKNGHYDFNKKLASQVVEESFETFFNINYHYRSEVNLKVQKDKLYKIISDSEDYLTISINSEFKKSKVSIAVGNHKIDGVDIKPSIKNELKFTNKKKENLIRILNQSEEEKADILILPEITIPFKWLKRIADESRRKERAIIGGIEHFSIHKYCYNYMVTSLPIKLNGLQESLIIPRLKNHYSPEESLLIRNIRFKVPVQRPHYYHLYKWRGIHFTAFNCYELADVKHRSLFKSKIDIMFASEYNRDWRYFSNVAESTTRDIHCYYVQSNTSDIGDSRIIQPTKTDRKDILRLKGGQKSSVLVATLDIAKLREFQELEYTGQKELKTFKATPPDFDNESINER